MKGQSEIIAFVLLFFIGIVLFSIAYIFSIGIFNQNIDTTKITATENIMRDLDNKIQSVIGYGGSQTVDYTLNEKIGILNPQTLEINFPVTIEFPKSWVNVTSSQRSYIREMLDGNIYRIQLSYPQASDINIEFFSETSVANPSTITIERNSTSNAGGKPIIRIRLVFK